MYATIDIETTGLNRFKDEINFVGIQLNKSLYDKNPKVYIFNWSDKKKRVEFVNLVNELKDKKVKLIWQNGKFDTLFLKIKTGIMLPISDDVMLMATAYDLADKHGLKYMAQKYLGVEDWDIKKKDKLSSNSDAVEPYLRCDLKYTWELYVFFKEVMDETQEKIYKNLLLPAYKTYRTVEMNGIWMNMN